MGQYLILFLGLIFCFVLLFIFSWNKLPKTNQHELSEDKLKENMKDIIGEQNEKQITTY